MAERNIKLWENWARSIEWFENDGQKAAFLLKIVRYAFFDEIPSIEQHEGSAWEMIKTAVDGDNNAVKNGGKGGRPRATKTPSETPSETIEKTPIETPLETSQETLSETLSIKNKVKNKVKEPPLPPLENCDNEVAEFGATALDVFNAEAGQDVRDLSPEAWAGLRRIHDAGRTLDDVRRVVKAKYAQWGSDAKMARFVRPSTLFGAKFDEYLNEPEGGVNDAEFDDLACGF